MALSPRTQSMMAPDQGAGSPDELFEAAFQDLALNQLVSQLPEIADSVVSMKMLELNADENTAVGTFIIMQGNDELHVPVIMADNELMPFDVMYVKSLDMMLPLTPEWLAELDRKDVEGMGTAVKAPEGLRTDEDIRNVVVPPTTGRYSYASAQLGQVLPRYLSMASNQVKTAFLKTLEKHPHIAKYAFEHYGVDTLRAATRQYAPAIEKTAEATEHVNFMTIETPTAEIKSVFGDRSDEAMRDIALQGYSTADQRSDVGELVSTERPLYLEVPGSTGFYRGFCSDGQQKNCLVFTQVLSLTPIGAELRLKSITPYGKSEQYNETGRLGVTGDGQMFMSSTDFLAEVLESAEVTPELASYCTAPRPGTPRNGQRGFFTSPATKNAVAIEPVQIDMVIHKEGKRTVYCRRYSDGKKVCLVQIEGSPITSPKAFTGNRGYHDRDFDGRVPDHFQTAAEKASKRFEEYTTTTILVPWHWSFVPIKGLIPEGMILRDHDAITALFYDGLTASGAPKVKIKAAGAGMVWIDGENLSRLDAIQKVAVDYGVSAHSADEAIKLANHLGHATFYAVNQEVERRFAQRVKLAQGAPPSAETQGVGTQSVPMAEPGAGMGPQEMPVDPATGQPVDPSMLPPPPPPPPSPIEIAANEVAQQISQEQQSIMQELQSQQESLQKQMDTIQMVMGRAEEIAQEQGVDPATGMPMTPDMMAPVDAQGMPVEQPGMMEQAMQLQDPEMFDAAAVASLASSNNYDVSVGSFMPTLREALDGIGRLLVEFRMKAGEMKTSIGDEMYSSLRDRLESLFSEFGATLIQLGNLTASAEGTSPM